MKKIETTQFSPGENEYIKGLDFIEKVINEGEL